MLPIQDDVSMKFRTSESALAAATILAVSCLSMTTKAQAQWPDTFPLSNCLSPPAIPALPLHGDGSSITLHWPVHPSSKGHTLWAQWRVPEGPVVKTFEQQLESSATTMTLPPSPQPWRHLMLLVELTRQCQDENGTTWLHSAPAEIRQLQFSAQHACPPVGGLARTAIAIGAPAPDTAPTAQNALRWQGQPQETFEITWFDTTGHRVLFQAEVTGAAVGWPASVQGGSLIRARRSCGEGRWSKPEYQRAP